MNIFPKTLRDNTPSAKQIFKALWKLLKRKKYFVIAFVVIIVVGFGIYGKYFNLTDAERAQKELAIAVAAVGKLMVLPEGDEPVLAAVTDAEALVKQQAFFTGAINGDQLLLFPKSLKAIIYSPSRNKIINAGPIEQSQQAIAPNTQAPNSKSQTNSNIQNKAIQNVSSVKVAFYNGTKTVGLANETEAKLKAGLLDFETVVKTNAAKKDYAETIVADLTGGEKTEEARSIANAIRAKIGDLPEGEIKPDADILIIVGNK